MPTLSAEGARIELGQHPDFERGWRGFQTALFSFMGLLVLAGLLGLLGSGPLAWRQKPADGQAFTIRYQGFARARAPEQILIEPAGQRSGHVTIHIDTALVDKLGIDKILPAPIASAADANGVFYLFALAPNATGKIVISAKPDSPGLLKGAVGINGQRQFINQIVWP